MNNVKGQIFDKSIGIVHLIVHFTVKMGRFGKSAKQPLTHSKHHVPGVNQESTGKSAN